MIYRCRNEIMKKIMKIMKTSLPKEQTWGRSKHVRRNERFLSLAQIDKLYHELNWNTLTKRAHSDFL